MTVTDVTLLCAHIAQVRFRVRSRRADIDEAREVVVVAAATRTAHERIPSYRRFPEGDEMESDPLEALIAAGVLTREHIAAAERAPAPPTMGRIARLALVGVNVDALLPHLANVARMRVATAEVFATP